MSHNVVAMKGAMGQKQKNFTFTNSRKASPSEHTMTKNASIKHENPAYFKRQSDQMKADQFGFQMKKDKRK